MNYKFITSCLLLLSTMNAAGQKPSMDRVTQRKPLFDFDKDRPIFKLQEEQLSNKHRHLRYVAFTGYREGVIPAKVLGNFDSQVDRENGTVRLFMNNMSIQDMLTLGFYKSSRIILEVKDPSKYRYVPSLGSKLEWMRTNAYCFEYMIPIGSIRTSKATDDELANFFGVKFGPENRTVDVLILTRTSEKDKIKSAGKSEININNERSFSNAPLASVVDALSEELMIPIIDETGYRDNVDVYLGKLADMDLEHLRNILKKYDLSLRSEKREMKMFVIKEIR